MESLQGVKIELLHLYKSNDVEAVNKLWNQVQEIVKSLSTFNPDSQDNLSFLLDDLLALFFECWAKAGLISTAVLEASVSLSKTLAELNKLNQDSMFTFKKLNELESICWEIESVFNSVKSSSGEFNQGITCLKIKLSAAFELSEKMKSELAAISDPLLPVYERLVLIKSELMLLLAKKNAHAFSLAQVIPLQDELGQIDSVRIDGKFMTQDGSVIPGQAIVIDLLEHCYDNVQELLALREPISGSNPLRPFYEKLITLKSKLEEMLETPWINQDEYLYEIQKSLGTIDNCRIDGKFMIDGNDTVYPGQAVLHFLLHKCYRIVYKLQNEETLASELLPIHRQLTTFVKCLKELKKWNLVMDQEDMVPYAMKFNYFEQQRKDGVFGSTTTVLEGQSILNALMDECLSLLQSFQLEIKRII